MSLLSIFEYTFFASVPAGLESFAVLFAYVVIQIYSFPRREASVARQFSAPPVVPVLPPLIYPAFLPIFPNTVLLRILFS